MYPAVPGPASPSPAVFGPKLGAWLSFTHPFRFKEDALSHGGGTAARIPACWFRLCFRTMGTNAMYLFMICCSEPAGNGLMPSFLPTATSAVKKYKQVCKKPFFTGGGKNKAEAQALCKCLSKGSRLAAGERAPR